MGEGSQGSISISAPCSGKRWQECQPAACPPGSPEQNIDKARSSVYPIPGKDKSPSTGFTLGYFLALLAPCLGTEAAWAQPGTSPPRQR